MRNPMAYLYVARYRTGEVRQKRWAYIKSLKPTRGTVKLGEAMRFWDPAEAQAAVPPMHESSVVLLDEAVIDEVMSEL